MSEPVAEIEKKKKKEKKSKKEKKAKKEATLAAPTTSEATPTPEAPATPAVEPQPVATETVAPVAEPAPKEKKQKKEKKSKREKAEVAPATTEAVPAPEAKPEVPEQAVEVPAPEAQPEVPASEPAPAETVENKEEQAPQETHHHHHEHKEHKTEHQGSLKEYVDAKFKSIESRLDALEALLTPENLRKILLTQPTQGYEPSVPSLQGSVSAVELRNVRADISALQSSMSVDSVGSTGTYTPYRSADEELQDLGNWEDALPKEAKDFVVKHELSKRTVWDFGPTNALGPDDIKAICDAVQQGPKQKKIAKLAFNFSSADNRLRTSKELAVALTEKPTLKEIVLHDPRRQSGWTFLGGLVDSDSSVVSVVLEDLDLPEAWSGAQAVKIISGCKWSEFVIQNSKRNTTFKREDVNPFYDNLVTGLASNKTITRFTLKNLPGASNGDVGRLVDGLRKNRSVTHLTVALEEVWDRLKMKSLADFIRTSPQIEELNISGVDKTIFDINDWIQALETSSLKRLIVTPLEVTTGGKKYTKGMLIDKYLEDKLKAICDKNGHLVIVGMKESAIPKELVISPTPQ